MVVATLGELGVDKGSSVGLTTTALAASGTSRLLRSLIEGILVLNLVRLVQIYSLSGDPVLIRASKRSHPTSWSSKQMRPHRVIIHLSILNRCHELFLRQPILLAHRHRA